MTGIKELKEKLTMQVYGMTKEEAHDKGICISCKKLVWEGDVSTPTPSMFPDEASMNEYVISGLCGPCFDQILEKAKMIGLGMGVEIKKGEML